MPWYETHRDSAVVCMSLVRNKSGITKKWHIWVMYRSRLIKLSKVACFNKKMVKILLDSAVRKGYCHCPSSQKVTMWLEKSVTCSGSGRNWVPSWSCLQAVSKPVWHTPLLCVQRKIPDDGRRNCPKHVEFYSKNKFEKLVHLVGFIIRNYHDARSAEHQKTSSLCIKKPTIEWDRIWALICLILIILRDMLWHTTGIVWGL